MANILVAKLKNMIDEYDQTHFMGTDFSGLDLSGFNFSGMTFWRADFSQTKLYKTKFCKAFMEECNFKGADLSEAKLRRPILPGPISLMWI